MAKVVDKQLIGYLLGAQSSADEQNRNESGLVSDSAPPHPANCTPTELRSFLSEHLPAHLIPTRFVWLHGFPLNVNGKVDREALPAPRIAPAADDADREPTEKEQLLLHVWGSVLPNAPAIGLHSNFFELGGDSIIALQIVSRSARVGLKITPAQLFQHQTIAELAEAAENGVVGVPREFVDPTQQEFALTPIQAWFVERRLVHPNHFYQSVGVALPRDVDRERLDRALAAVFRRHDALRLRLRGDRQAYADSSPARVAWLDVPPSDSLGNDHSEDENALFPPLLSITEGPVFAAFGWTEDQEPRIALVAHHFTIDAVSWRIVLEDLFDAYTQTATSESPLLPVRTASYQAWSNQLSAAVEKARSDATYWQEIARSYIPPDFLTRSRGSANTVAASATATIDLSTESTALLLRSGRVASVLVAALVCVVRDRFGAGSVTIDRETHGRDAEALGFDLDVSRTVGWFTAIHPLTIRASESASRDALIDDVQRQIDAVPNNG
ncbi:MAG: condensation domain-containing protein, partial [Planctomycetota bacterium]